MFTTLWMIGELKQTSSHCDITLSLKVQCRWIWSSFWKFVFALTVSIHIQMSFGEIRQKKQRVFSYFRATCAIVLMFTLQPELELSTLPSIPSNGHAGDQCYFLFYYNLAKLLSCFFFLQNLLKFLYDRVQVFHRQTPPSPSKKIQQTSRKRSKRF